MLVHSRDKQGCQHYKWIEEHEKADQQVEKEAGDRDEVVIVKPLGTEKQQSSVRCH